METPYSFAQFQSDVADLGLPLGKAFFDQAVIDAYGRTVAARSDDAEALMAACARLRAWVKASRPRFKDAPRKPRNRNPAVAAKPASPAPAPSPLPPAASLPPVLKVNEPLPSEVLALRRQRLDDLLELMPPRQQGPAVKPSAPKTSWLWQAFVHLVFLPTSKNAY